MFLRNCAHDHGHGQYQSVCEISSMPCTRRNSIPTAFVVAIHATYMEVQFQHFVAQRAIPSAKFIFDAPLNRQIGNIHRPRMVSRK